MESLGVQVLRSVPSQRGFNQPCPLWQGQCTIYTTPHYPRFCRTYKCRLLKKLLDQTTSLDKALAAVEETKDMIQQIEALLPDSPNANFRERLAAQLEETEDNNPEVRRGAQALLGIYQEIFGVDDVIE
jgi:hypothetical protein